MLVYYYRVTIPSQLETVWGFVSEYTKLNLWWPTRISGDGELREGQELETSWFVEDFGHFNARILVHQVKHQHKVVFICHSMPLGAVTRSVITLRDTVRGCRVELSISLSYGNMFMNIIMHVSLLSVSPMLFLYTLLCNCIWPFTLGSPLHKTKRAVEQCASSTTKS